jgi:hypothetical protein
MPTVFANGARRTTFQALMILSGRSNMRGHDSGKKLGTQYPVFRSLPPQRKRSFREEENQFQILDIDPFDCVRARAWSVA